MHLYIANGQTDYPCFTVFEHDYVTAAYGVDLRVQKCVYWQCRLYARL